MKRFAHQIITASAGTGKTYRLALEYIRIVLNHYLKVEDFHLDNILVLTFTRKATAEIRERIVKHLDLLCSTDPEEAKDRQVLLHSLFPDQADPSLDLIAQNTLFSALLEISADRKQLQVMTIDAYINSIFRNIVRPLRSIDHFEIDPQAVEKRLPFLMEHLMNPAFKSRLDSLLSRKISPSLDEYRQFFTSLINARWLYFQIGKQRGTSQEGTLQHLRGQQGTAAAESHHEELLETLSTFLELLQSKMPGSELSTLFNADFKSLFREFPATFPALLKELRNLLATPQGCYRFFEKCSKSSLFNGRKFTAKALADTRSKLLTLQDNVRRSLANYLIHTHFLQEQEEILDVWKAILDEYDKLIYRYKNMTYNDVAWFSLEALFSDDPPNFDLQNEVIATEFYQFLAHRSRFILMDEFQDTSLMQFAILKPIIEEVTAGQGTKDFGGVIVVGDEKQSIFGWRGGERDLLLNLRELFPTLKNVQPEPLGKSYRSSMAMVDFINAIFTHSGIHAYLQERGLAWSYNPVNQALDELDDQTYIELKTAAYSLRNPEQSLRSVYRDFVVNSIEPALKKYPKEDVAILCRTVKELGELQQVLDEQDITSIYQPSSTLLQHPWITPLIAWIRFLAFGDWLDWLEFLRSNYVLLKAAPLKTLVEAISLARETDTAPDFQACPTAAALYQHALAKQGSLSQICLQLLDLCLPGKNIGERDYLNIQAFLTLVQNFELARAERDKSIPAFLDYLEDNSGQDFMKQVSIEGKGTLQLLSIHKSKGLQFDRVFVFYNLSAHQGNDAHSLKYYTDYAGYDFQDLRDYALTYHYADLLKHSDYRALAENAENRELLEEMNTLYVAFTRAKTALQVCFAYQGNENWAQYREEKKTEQPKLPVLICEAAQSYYTSRGLEPAGENRYVFSGAGEGKPETKEVLSKQEGITTENLALALPPRQTDPLTGMAANQTDEDKDWKKIWVENRRNLLGNLIHHYLSFVRRNLQSEHEYAARQCLSFYGSILTQSEILNTIGRLRQSLQAEPELFDPRYDKVFTEYTLYHRGRELRLDRLMLDTKNKQALILDYKTGVSRQQEQLDQYLQALQSTNAISSQGYTVSARFLVLKGLEDLTG